MPHSVGWGRALALGSAVAWFGCSPGAELAWTFEFGPDVDRSQVIAIETAIRRDTCESAPFFQTTVTREEEGAAPPQLDPGVYAITARARTQGCEWIAAGCELLEVPFGVDALVVPLAAMSPSESMCTSAERCEAAACVSALVDCSERPNGEQCTPIAGNICLDGVCVASRCGDGFVDPTNDETCDDGNQDAGDGCEPGRCQPECVADLDCDDGESCTTDELCVAGVCQEPNVQSDGVDCDRDGDAGICRSGRCVPPGCGNGVPDSGEECDDMNTIAGDGCELDCTFTCELDVECDDGNPCNGLEECLPGHICGDSPPPGCDDGEPCTADACDENTPLGFDPCVHTLIDDDHDGYAPAVCLNPSLMGRDCDDTNPSVYNGAPEGCDGIDNDCDTEIDEEDDPLNCYADDDGDGFGDPDDVIVDCACPAGRVTLAGDCLDEPGLYGPSVNPGVTAFSTSPYCVDAGCATTSYDWDCSGSEETEFPSTVADCSCEVARSGWNDVVPACGGRGDWLTCGGEINFPRLPAPMLPICGLNFEFRIQGCR